MSTFKKNNNFKLIQHCVSVSDRYQISIVRYQTSDVGIGNEKSGSVHPYILYDLILFQPKASVKNQPTFPRISSSSHPSSSLSSSLAVFSVCFVLKGHLPFGLLRLSSWQWDRWGSVEEEAGWTGWKVVSLKCSLRFWCLSWRLGAGSLGVELIDCWDGWVPVGGATWKTKKKHKKARNWLVGQHISLLWIKRIKNKKKIKKKKTKCERHWSLQISSWVLRPNICVKTSETILYMLDVSNR